MQKTLYYCDACNAKMDVEEVTSSVSKIQEYLAQVGSNLVPGEIFCSACLIYASDYWQAKGMLLVELGQENIKRVERHRKSFFSERLKRPQAVRSPLEVVN